MDYTRMTFLEKNDKAEKQILVEITWLKKLTVLLLFGAIIQIIVIIFSFVLK